MILHHPKFSVLVTPLPGARLEPQRTLASTRVVSTRQRHDITQYR